MRKFLALLVLAGFSFVVPNYAAATPTTGVSSAVVAQRHKKSRKKSSTRKSSKRNRSRKAKKPA